MTPAALAEAHAEYERRHAAPHSVERNLFRCAAPIHANGMNSVLRTNVRDPHRRLRLGFVSPDLVRHPVGFFLVRVLENLVISPLPPGEGQGVRASAISPLPPEETQGVRASAISFLPPGEGQGVRASAISPLPPGEGQGVRAVRRSATPTGSSRTT